MSDTPALPDPDLCVMRPDRPHVCLRPDHDERHGKAKNQ